jgi:hypothetical protein
MLKTRHDGRRISKLVILGLAAAGMGGAALAAEKPAKFEQIPGSDLKRVILTPKAAQRLAIATVEIREEPVLRWLMVEGTVEAMPLEAGADPARVRVHLVDNPNSVLADPGRNQSQSRLIVSLKDDDDGDVSKDADAAKTKERPPAVVVAIGRARAARLPATPIRVAAAGNSQTAGATAALSQDYLVAAPDHGLRPGQRVYAKILHPDSGKPQMVVPYSAVIYDTKGVAWVYTNPEPLVFIRHRIEIEAIEATRAILREGPALGTKIVTAAAPELLGVEQKFGQ